MAVFLYASLVEVGILPLSGTADPHLHEKQLTLVQLLKCPVKVFTLVYI